MKHNVNRREIIKEINGNQWKLWILRFKNHNGSQAKKSKSILNIY